MTAANNPLGGFAVAVEFAGPRAVLGVRGEMDAASAPKLSAFFDAVIATGYLAVTLDLVDCDFVDLAGLRVISYAASRLVAAGGDLTIRSPSAAAARTLDITWLAGLVGLEVPATASDHLGPEQSAVAAGTTVRSGPASPTQDPRRVTALPADDNVVDGALRLVVALARATVGGADGVSVSLRRRGRLATVAASDQTILDMDAGQYATGEGPCVSASVDGHWFHVESLDTETRWPAFTPRAQALGINAILSSPLLAQDGPVGALNIYSRTPAAFGPKDQELAATFATEASTILTDAGADITDDQLSAWRTDALRTRQLITLAQGAIMARSGIDEERAYAALLRLSVETNTPLRHRAEAVIATTRRSQPGRAASAEYYLG
jgi:anti-anti-sigma factor